MVSSSSAKLVETKNSGHRHPQPLTPPYSRERPPPMANRFGFVDPWMVDSAVDDETDEEEYNQSLPLPLTRRPSTERSIYRDDNERSEDDNSKFKEPGNFWSNPVHRPDLGSPAVLPFNQQHPTTTRPEIRRPRPTADPDAPTGPRP